MLCIFDATHNLLLSIRAIDEFVDQSLRDIELPTVTHILSLVYECGHAGRSFACSKVMVLGYKTRSHA